LSHQVIEDKLVVEPCIRSSLGSVDGDEVEELRHREYDGEGLHAYQPGVPAVQFDLLDGQSETERTEIDKKKKVRERGLQIRHVALAS
jgi:hypothetical protein